MKVLRNYRKKLARKIKCKLSGKLGQRHFIDRMFHRPNVSSTECFIDQMFHRSNVSLTECFIDQMFHRPNVSSTECFIDCIFLQLHVSSTRHFTDQKFHKPTTQQNVTLLTIVKKMHLVLGWGNVCSMICWFHETPPH